METAVCRRKNEDGIAIPVLARTELLLTGGSVQTVERALRYRMQGRRVLIAAPFACLGGEGERIGNEPGVVEKKLLETPDVWKKRLEDTCEQAGIEVLYGIREIGEDADPEEPGRSLFLAACKSGMYAISCIRVLREDAEEKPVCGIYISRGDQVCLWEKGGGGRGRNAAESYLELEDGLLDEYAAQKKKDSSLRLGRCAFRRGGMLTELFGADTELGWQEISSGSGMEQWLGRDTVVWNGSVKGKVCRCDVLVAGGGTAGVMAALHAARTGAETVLLEGQRELGGTSVAGGVSAYWFGNRFRDVQEIDKEVQRESVRCAVPAEKGIWGDCDSFHPALKGHVLLRLCLQAGVNICFGQTVYGTLQEKGRVIGTVSAGDGGNLIVYARQIIDATGDGDLAVFAGAEAEYGSDRDCITYWGSLAQYTGIDSYQNNFSSMYLESDPWDTSRFIRVGRQRGGRLFDHGTLVCSRESRHIRGKKRIDLRDMCTLRCYRDGLYTCYSNYDPKGKLDADMVYCGWLVPQMRIQIPLSALLPVDREGRRIRGLYIAGKAVSATHNAFPSIRMQPDLMHQGAVLGILTAEAVKRGCDVDELEPGEYQRWISERTGDDLQLADTCAADRGSYVWKLKKEERTSWVDVPFSYEEQKLSSILALVTAEREKVEIQIRRRLEVEKDKEIKRMLYRLLLWHGCGDAAERMAQEVEKALSGEELPGRKGSVMCAQLLPDHGVMPEAVYDLNLLSLSGSALSMKPYERVLELLERGKRDYEAISKGIYHYVECFAYAAEHTGRKEFAPLLSRLKLFPELKEAVKKGGGADLMTERFQILWFILSRAQACLGEREGYEDLIRLLDADSRSLAVSAGLALAELAGGEESGETLYGRDAWQRWLDRRERLPVRITKEKRW